MTHITRRALVALASKWNSTVDSLDVPANEKSCGPGAPDSTALGVPLMVTAITIKREPEELARVTCPACRIRIDAALEGLVIGPEAKP